MRRTIAYIFLLLFLNAPSVRTAPTTPGAGTDTGVSLIQLNNLGPFSPSTASNPSSSFCLKRNDDNQLSAGEVRTHRFAVPRTTTILNVFYCPGHPIDRDLVREIITTARTHMDHQMAIYGDGPLQPVDDPYSASVVAGMKCIVEITSLRRRPTQVIPNPLTYQTTLNALSGMFEFMLTEDHAVSALVEVVDPGLTGSMIRIGLMSIGRVQ